MSESLASLQNSRESLIKDLLRIDQKRGELLAWIIMANRQRGMQKSAVAKAKAERTLLLADRDSVREQLGKVNKKIRDLRIQQNGGIPSVCVCAEYEDMIVQMATVINSAAMNGVEPSWQAFDYCPYCRGKIQR